MKKILIVGATGDVGNGAATALLQAGHRVLAVSRGGAKADALRERHKNNEAFRLVQGSVDDELAAGVLVAKIREHAETVDAVVAGIHTPPDRLPTLLDWDSVKLQATIHDNLITHFVALKTLLPLVARGGLYLGIGGGMADRIFPRYGYNSMLQSSLRMMFRYVDHETRGNGVHIRELIIAARVTTETKHNTGDPKVNWISDSEVGQHILAMIEDPVGFPGPIQQLNSPKGVGRSREEPLNVPPRPAAAS